jgi:hypothetical protein
MPVNAQKDSRKRKIIESDHESSDAPSPAPVKASSSRARKPRMPRKPAVVDIISEGEDLSFSTTAKTTKSSKSKNDWIPSRTRKFTHKNNENDDEEENVFESLL